jgi:hypothetical protein
MCPAGITTVVPPVAGATSAGAVTALILQKHRAKSNAQIKQAKTAASYHGGDCS